MPNTRSGSYTATPSDVRPPQANDFVGNTATRHPSALDESIDLAYPEAGLPELSFCRRPTTAIAAASCGHLQGYFPGLAHEYRPTVHCNRWRLSYLETPGNRDPAPEATTMVSSDLSRRSAVHTCGTSAPGKLHLYPYYGSALWDS